MEPLQELFNWLESGSFYRQGLKFEACERPLADGCCGTKLPKVGWVHQVYGWSDGGTQYRLALDTTTRARSLVASEQQALANVYRRWNCFGFPLALMATHEQCIVLMQGSPECA